MKISLACSETVTENADRSLVAIPTRLSLSCEYCLAISVMLISVDWFQNPDVADSGPGRSELWADRQIHKWQLILSFECSQITCVCVCYYDLCRESHTIFMKRARAKSTFFWDVTIRRLVHTQLHAGVIFCILLQGSDTPMKATVFSSTFAVTYQKIRSYVPHDSHVNTHNCDQFKSRSLRIPWSMKRPWKGLTASTPCAACFCMRSVTSDDRCQFIISP